MKRIYLIAKQAVYEDLKWIRGEEEEKRKARDVSKKKLAGHVVAVHSC